ncbi:MAG TPA: hypothetical protein VFE47_19005 [Tepidisphaeraceae bacterium]|nr:hypothetical protein [Tepidisphaeraceae bacterium]
MRSKTVLALILLNLVLLGSLCFRNGFLKSANAQVPRIPEPSEYIQVSGEAQGVPGGVVYIYDTRNHFMAVRTMNPNQNKMADFDALDLSKVFK